jgi:hypothetical protein
VLILVAVVDTGRWLRLRMCILSIAVSAEMVVVVVVVLTNPKSTQISLS